MTYNSQAIILGVSDFKEYDRLYRVFLKDYGKKKIIAKGIRRFKSKLRGKLLFFSEELL